MCAYPKIKNKRNVIEIFNGCQNLNIKKNSLQMCLGKQLTEYLSPFRSTYVLGEQKKVDIELEIICD